MTTICTPLTADTTVYTADNAVLTADMTEICVTVGTAVGGGGSRRERRRMRQVALEIPFLEPIARVEVNDTDLRRALEAQFEGRLEQAPPAVVAEVVKAVQPFVTRKPAGLSIDFGAIFQRMDLAKRLFELIAREEREEDDLEVILLCAC